MTSKLVVNTIEADTGISSVSFASSISMSSTSKFHFGNAGIDIGADTNINRPASGVLGFNINSSEKVRISDNGAIGLGGANYGSSGQVLTSGGSGSAVTWSTVSGTTINNNADNRLITGSGTANTLNGEANLTFDGNNLAMSGTGVFTLTRNSRTLTLEGNYGNEGHPAIKTSSGHDLRIFTSGNNERLRITSDGKVGINENDPSNQLHIAGTTGTSAGGLLRLDATTGDNFIIFDNTGDSSEWVIGNDSGSNDEFRMYYNGGSGYGHEIVNVDGTTNNGKVTIDGGTNTLVIIRADSAGTAGLRLGGQAGSGTDQCT